MKNKIIIISFLLAIIVLSIWIRQIDKAEVEYVEEYQETSKVMDELSFPIMSFVDANGRLPVSLDEMRQYFESDKFKKTRSPGYDLKDNYYDAWGTPLIWGSVYGHEKYEKITISAGPDREFGTSDDFQMWSWRGKND